MPSVTLDWVQELPFKMQSSLFSGLRGPDTGHCPHLKRLVRWLRPATQQDADPTTEYMRAGVLPQWADVKKELEFTTVHYFEHLLDAVQIVGYRHPRSEMRGQAQLIHLKMVLLLNCQPETEEQFNARLG